jgi:sarcosine oxidase subunit beta
MSPYVNPEGLLAATFSARDGHCTPEAVVAGYAAGARAHGATIRRHCTVTGIDVVDGAVTGVRTDAGTVGTGTVICAAGAWSARVGELAGVALPVRPLRRQVVVSEPVADLPPELPFTIDFGTSFYFHDEGPGLLMGMSDSEQGFGFDTSRSAEWLGRFAEVVARRAPALSEVGIAHGWAGLYEMTPDHNSVVGEAAAVSRFLYATGFSGHGFLQAPAVGEIVRDLVLEREPFVDVSALSADRFSHGHQRPERNII